MNHTIFLVRGLCPPIYPNQQKKKSINAKNFAYPILIRLYLFILVSVLHNLLLYKTKGDIK